MLIRFQKRNKVAIKRYPKSTVTFIHTDTHRGKCTLTHMCVHEYMNIHRKKINKFCKYNDSDLLKQFNSLKDQQKLMIPKGQ